MFGSSSEVGLGINADAAPEKPKRKRVLWGWSLLALGLIVVFFLYRCSSGMAITAAQSDADVAAFHKALDGEQYQNVYATSDEGFRRSGAEDELTEFLRAVHRKLGPVTSCQRQNIFVNASTNGTFATVNYDTVFEKGKGQETFVWHVTGSELKLFGYHINSRELITR